MAFKMRGSAFKLGNVATKSALKQTYDVHDTDTRVYDIDQNKYDAWSEGKEGAPDIRYLGARENKKWIEDYLKSQEEGSEMQQQSSKPRIQKPQKGAWGKFLSETKEEDFLNEDGSLNVEAHKKAIDDSLIRNGLKPKPEGWVDPAATAAGEFVGEATRLPEVTVTPNRTREQIIQELKDTYGEAYLDMDQEQIDYIVKMQMKMDAEGTEGEKVTP